VRRDTVNPQSKKRLYRNIFTIAVSSEFFLGQIEEIQQTRGADAVLVNLDVFINEPAIPPSPPKLPLGNAFLPTTVPFVPGLV
jgi:hypothetical protein